MKLFISTTEGQYYGSLPEAHSETYAVADKIDTICLSFLGPGYQILCRLDNGGEFRIRFAKDLSKQGAEQALYDLCQLIGKHSTDGPGTAMIKFDGQRWCYQ